MPGRPRLFEVVQRINEVNQGRKEPVDFLIAPPRMARYIEVSTEIYNVYLHYIAPEDIHSYSIDEVFMDVTHYLSVYNMTTEELARRMIKDVYDKTGITATAGIGTNLYLTKVAMDILAKHAEPDENGVRLAFLDEQTYKEKLWTHQPISDFWRVGAGYRKKLAKVGLYTMGDIARCSLGSEQDFYNPELLYKLFGVNAELLIDHAWGIEPATMADIKAYKPETNSISSGQVLTRSYTTAEARLVVHEMIDDLSLDLYAKKLLTDQLILTVGYDITSLSTAQSLSAEVKNDRYGHATDEKERKLQEAMLSVKNRYGKNAMLKGMNLQDGATALSRNEQIGGHKA